MLRTRIITALILAPLALAAVIYLPTSWVALIFGVVAALAAYEWAGLADLTGRGARAAYVALFALVVAGLYVMPGAAVTMVALGCVAWLGAAAVVVTFPRFESWFKRGLVTGVVGLLLLSSAWSGLVEVHAAAQGPYWLIWTLLVVWGADIGGYFAGRAFGRRKLAPAVSPGKTWEGAAGGLLLAGAVCGGSLPWLTAAWPSWLPVLVGLVVVSVFGDLFESVLKRSTGVKDSGTLLPGHGGVLDRIDALIAVLPFMALALM